MQDLKAIRKQLSLLEKNDLNFFTWSINPFLVKIYPCHIQDHFVLSCDKITDYAVLDVDVHEIVRTDLGPTFQLVDLISDTRFKNYKPIQYDTVGAVNFSDGGDMPIEHLCELIKYIYRLSNLVAFL